MRRRRDVRVRAPRWKRAVGIAPRAKTMPADAATATYGAFLDRLATRTSADASSSSSSVVATSADAYAAYVALMRSGLWTDVVPATCPSTGLTYMFCLPRETPTERRKDVPREARSRTVAVPFAVARACASPTLLDAVTRVAGASFARVRGDDDMMQYSAFETQTDHVLRIASRAHRRRTVAR